ncbi:MAG: tetratricopeptide repeat protein, partial [Armatimonadota bacterium]
LWRLNSRSARAALEGSVAYLTPFLAQCLQQALSHSRRPLRLASPAEALPPPTGRYDLWLVVCDSFILESDHWWHKGDYEQTIRCQQTAVFFDPTNVEAFTNVAWLQWSMGRHGQAVSTYRQAIAANPRSWQAADALGQYYLRHHQTEVGVQYLQAAATLGSPPVPRRSLGHALEKLGRVDEARGVWSAILEMDPNDPIALRQLARLKGQ